MDPTTVGCPHGPCHASGQTGMGQSGIQAPQAQRFLCHACHPTFSARQGTVCSRLRTSAETVGLVVPWLAPGCPVPALVAACGFAERTVAAWWARAGRQGQAGQEALVERPRDLGQVQADASRVQHQGGIGWMALAMRVQTRVGLGGEGREPRAMPLIRGLSACVRRGAARRPLWVCPEGLVASSRARRETLRDPVHTGQGGRPRRRPWRPVWLAHVVKRDERRRVVETERRGLDGTPARVETLRPRSHGDGVMQTASMARRPAPCRARLAPRARRGRARARHTLTRPEGRCWVGTV